MNQTDCIVGLASGTPDGGVAVIRLSGPGIQAMGCTLLGSLPRPRMASLRRVRAEDGSSLDEALVLWMPGPASFTGEDVLELHVHAGRAHVRQILERCLSVGARSAQAGEFSRRAFANGKLSLDQIEALPGLLAAQSDQELSRARRLLRGELGEEVDRMVRSLLTLRVEVEAHLDFADDMADLDPGPWLGSLHGLRKTLDHWLSTQRAHRPGAGRIRLAIAGPPNAGKSSLFNALVGRERSIVSGLAGTTRDFVESSLCWEGVTFDLVDTAGLRSGAETIEAAGIELGRKEIAAADLVLWVDPSGADEAGQRWLREGVDPSRILWVASKFDLGDAREGWVSVSLQPGYEHTVSALRDLLEQRVAELDQRSGQDWIGLERHGACVARAREELDGALTCLEADSLELEIVAFHLGSAAQALGEIRGQEYLRPVGEEVLNAIFSNFCIGK